MQGWLRNDKVVNNRCLQLLTVCSRSMSRESRAERVSEVLLRSDYRAPLPTTAIQRAHFPHPVDGLLDVSRKASATADRSDQANPVLLANRTTTSLGRRWTGAGFS